MRAALWVARASQAQESLTVQGDTGTAGAWAGGQQANRQSGGGHGHTPELAMASQPLNFVFSMYVISRSSGSVVGLICVLSGRRRGQGVKTVWIEVGQGATRLPSPPDRQVGW